MLFIGISTIANGTVRFLTTPATSNVQLNKVYFELTVLF